VVERTIGQGYGEWRQAMPGMTVRSRAMKPLEQARVAIVHEWLDKYTGSERVLAAMLEVFPGADLYALIHDPDGLRGTPLERVPVQTSFMQSLPLVKKNYRTYLPLMPLAVERFTLSAYDIVVSSSHAVAKAAIVPPGTLHVCYLQARNLKYAYEDRFFYPGGKFLRLVQDSLLTFIRVWDEAASKRPAFTIANSQYVSGWHLHRHGVPSMVIYPPVDVSLFSSYFQPSRYDDYYVTAGRLEPYKRMDAVVEAFNRLGLRLVVLGEGSMLGALRRMAAPNIKFVGHCNSKTVARVFASAKAFVFASREDFGIAPLEAQACGTPVIAYGEGGALETVVGWPAPDATGMFFDAQTPDALAEAVRFFEEHDGEFKPESCRRNAERFGEERFREEFQTTMERLWSNFQRGERLE
jgi:glycosyltransferase involved in cell wall biosynthesis